MSLNNLNAYIKIENDAFDSLEKLEWLELGLDYDQLWETGIISDDSDDFADYVERNIYSFNNLKPDVFSHLKSLKRLDMQGCLLTSVNEEWFTHLNELLYLDLRSNEIETLDPSIFISLKNLQRLALSPDQVTFYKGKSVSQEEFKKLMNDLVNKDVEVRFYR